MSDIYLFLGVIFVLTLALGRKIERLHVPWIFSALVIGTVMAEFDSLSSLTTTPVFQFLAQLGMYFLLFMIGYELDLKKLKEQSLFIARATFFIIFFEAAVGSIIIHFFFDLDWIISIVVALSFATVGEAVLIPILQEFKIVNTRIGQSIIGIGSLDDIVELAALVFVIFLIGSGTGPSLHPVSILIAILSIIAFAYLLKKVGKQESKLLFTDTDSLFLLVLSVFFIFLGLGKIAHSEPIAAILAGITLNTFVPPSRLSMIEREIKALSYGLFAPIFFIWVGASLDLPVLLASPFLIILIVLATSGAKIISSIIMGKNVFSLKESVLLGLGLSVRFSTSIIIAKILFENQLITSELYSVLVASSIIFTFIIPFLFSHLLVRWNLRSDRKIRTRRTHKSTRTPRPRHR